MEQQAAKYLIFQQKTKVNKHFWLVPHEPR